MNCIFVAVVSLLINAINGCVIAPCLNGGTCDVATDMCSCVAGFTGANCETVITPPAPGGITWLNSTLDSTYIQWTQSGYVTSYKVLVNNGSVTSTVSFNGVGSPLVTANVSSLPTPGQVFCVMVIAVNNGETSTNASENCQLRTVPSAVSEMTWLNSTHDAFKIQWSQLGVVDNYQLSVSGLESLNISYSGLGSSNVLTTVSGLPTPATAYCLTVTAVSGQLHSSQTVKCDLRTAPAAPSNLTWLNSTEYEVIVGWVQAGAVDSYSIVLNISSQPTINFYGVGSGQVSAAVQLTSPNNSHTYCLSVTANTAQIISQVTAKCGLRTAPPAPEDLSAVNSTQNSLTVSWTQRGIVDSYRVHLDNSVTGNIGFIGLGTNFVIATLYDLPSSDTAYCVSLTAVSGTTHSSQITHCDLKTKGYPLDGALLAAVIALSVIIGVILATGVVLSVFGVKLLRTSDNKDTPTTIPATTAADAKNEHPYEPIRVPETANNRFRYKLCLTCWS